MKRLFPMPQTLYWLAPLNAGQVVWDALKGDLLWLVFHSVVLVALLLLIMLFRRERAFEQKSLAWVRAAIGPRFEPQGEPELRLGHVEAYRAWQLMLLQSDEQPIAGVPPAFAEQLLELLEVEREAGEGRLRFTTGHGEDVQELLVSEFPFTECELWLGSLVGTPSVYPPRERFEAQCGQNGMTPMLVQRAAHLHEPCTHGPVPDPNCSCGIYALSSGNAVETNGVYLAGKVALWGRIVEHTGGYRAQYAYPLNLWLPEPLPRLRRYLEARYGVPVLWAGQLQVDA